MRAPRHAVTPRRQQVLIAANYLPVAELGMSDEIDNLANALGDVLKVQRIHNRRIKNVEEATLALKELVVRMDARVDTLDDWRGEADQRHKKIAELNQQTADIIKAIRELTLENASHSGETLAENARQSAENQRAIAALREVQAENVRQLTA